MVNDQWKFVCSGLPTDAPKAQSGVGFLLHSSVWGAWRDAGRVLSYGKGTTDQNLTQDRWTFLFGYISLYMHLRSSVRMRKRTDFRTDGVGLSCRSKS